jgi:hypothetical protein
MSNKLPHKIKTQKKIPLEILKLSAMGWLQILDDLLLPLTYILGGALLYSELDKVFAETTSASEVLLAIGDDIMSDPSLAIAFVVVLLLWLLTKFRRNPIDKKLDNINDKLDILVQRGEHDDGKTEDPKSKM